MSETRFEVAKLDGDSGTVINALQAERSGDLASQRTNASLRQPVSDVLQSAIAVKGRNMLAIDDLPGGPGDVMHLLQSANPTAAEKKLLDASKTMEADNDPKSGLGKAEPGFKDAVSTADASLKAVVERGNAMSPDDIALAQRQIEESAKVSKQLSQALENVQVPPSLKGKITQAELRDKLAAKVDDFKHSEPGVDYSYNGVVKDLEPYPELFALAMKDKTLSQSEPVKAYKQISNDFLRAYADAALTRLVYADALNAGGRPIDSWQQKKEAMALFGVKLPDTPTGMHEA